MSFLGGLADSITEPFTRTFQGFKQVFTNPGKANLGDFVSVAAPGAGGLLVADVANPTNVVYQAGLGSLVVGGAGLAGYGPLAAAPAAPAATSLLPNSPLLANLPGPQLVDPAAAAIAGLPFSPVDATATTLPNSPLLSNVASDAGLKSLISTGASKVASAVKAGASFIKGTAEVSIAAKAAVSPWQKAVDAVKGFVGGGSGSSGARGVTVAGGGGLAPQGGKGAAPAGSSPVLLLGVAGAAVALYFLMPKKRSA